MAVTKITRVCAECGVTFETPREVVQCCSRGCANRRRRSASTRVCEHCGSTFQKAAAGKGLNAKFCSRVCYIDYCRSHKRVKICEKCGLTFEPKDGMTTARFCSTTCAGLGKRQEILIRGYRWVRRNNVPVVLHRARAEAALGHPLPVGAEVHHADGTRADNAPLVICQDSGYHHLLHQRMRIRAAGGNPNTDRICCRCKAVLPLTSFSKAQATCRSCARDYRLVVKARLSHRRSGLVV